MIVEPDFLEHWKTRLLVRLLDTEEAPLYVLRLWAHCQHRKTDRFTGWKPDVLASVCRWVGPSQTLWDSMLQTFAEIDKDGAFVAHGWAECNAGLLAAWSNGKLGGRPKKAKENEGSGTEAKPTGNPSVIQRETQGQTDRVDREEKTSPLPPQPKEQPLQLEAEPPTRRDPLSGFNLFWQAYPRKAGRAPAEKAWAKLNPDEHTTRKIVEHVQARRSHPDWTKDAGQFIPHASTFLNQRRWEDELTQGLGPSGGGRALSHEERLLAKAGVSL